MKYIESLSEFLFIMMYICSFYIYCTSEEESSKKEGTRKFFTIFLLVAATLILALDLLNYLFELGCTAVEICKEKCRKKKDK